MAKYYRLFFLVMLSALLAPLSSYGQQLAFPGAEGFGRFTSGGRGGIVYEVTNLNDAGPGSLREGINMVGARTIVFRVSGTIHLESELKIRNGNLTIAGQSAPGDGIAIKGSSVVVDADNIIIRYIRFRPGDISGGEPDAIWGRNQKDIIIDHCSMSWAVDETSSFYDNKNFTMQWCLLSESLYESQHEKGRHGYGGIWGGQGATFHHNILAHHSSRNPRFNGSRYSGEPDLEIVDYRNNVIYNWGGNSAYGGEDGNHNMVANYYKAGPAASGDKRSRILDASTVDSSDPVLGRWHVEDNYVDGFPEVTADNWNGGVQGLNTDQLEDVRYDVPFPFAPVTTQTALEAFKSVLENAGANLPKRDAVDARIIGEIESGTVNFGGAYGAMKGIIDSQEQVGGWPNLLALPAPEDSDHDGMPDAWEIENDLDPNDAEDGKLIGEDGYTNLENYLNSLVVPSHELLEYPTNLLVQAQSSSTIYLSWENNEESEHTLILERSTDGVEFAQIADLPGGATTFTDEALEEGNAYYYRLLVENHQDSYVFSDVVSTSTFALPDKAADPSPGDDDTGIDPNLLSFFWNGDAFAYKLFLGTAADDLDLIADNLSTASHQITDLSEATAYYWRVDGVSEGGEEVEGEVWSFTTSEITAVKNSTEDFIIFNSLPNPFSDQLTFMFELKKAESVEISLYDMHQRLIFTAVDESFGPAAHEISLNQEILSHMSNGVYFCVFKVAGSVKKVERLIYIK